MAFMPTGVSAATIDEHFLTDEGFEEFLERHQTDEEVRDALARYPDFRDGLVERFFAVKGFIEKEELKAKAK